MPERIEGDPPLPFGGVVAQQPGRQRVACLVEGDGHQRDCGADEVINALCCHIVLLTDQIYKDIVLFFRAFGKRLGPRRKTLKKKPKKSKKRLHFVPRSGKIVKLIILNSRLHC